jgi:hypothetical protein
MRKKKLKVALIYLSKQMCMHPLLTNAHTYEHTPCTHTHAVSSMITAHPEATVDATEWNEVILTCSASGTPTPTIRWEREGGGQLPAGAVPSSPESMSENTVIIIIIAMHFKIK